MNPSSLFSLDLMSVAMTSVPKSIPVLSGIYKLSTDIRETTERVEVNQKQCQQLSERIDTLIGFLAQRDLSSCLSEAMHIALHRFETFLRQCLEFISTFAEISWFKRIINNKDHERKFQDLNRELTQYSNDLNFGIGLSNMQVNKKVDGNSPGLIRRASDELEPNHQQYTEEIEPSSPEVQATVFISGTWQYRYNQYNQWFGPFRQQLNFNPSTGTLTGYGQDNVGQYLLSGSFSDTTGQIEMIQHYRVGGSIHQGMLLPSYAWSSFALT